MWGLNLLGLRYWHRAVEFSEDLRAISYRFHSDQEHVSNVRVDDPIRGQTGRDIFLAGRWRSFTLRLNHLIRIPVEHEPWPLYAATARGRVLTARGTLDLPFSTTSRSSSTHLGRMSKLPPRDRLVVNDWHRSVA